MEPKAPRFRQIGLRLGQSKLSYQIRRPEWTGPQPSPAGRSLVMSTADDPLPDLMRSLSHTLPDQRARGARALGRLGWLARDALPLLASAIHDSEPTVREAAAQAVGQMGPDALPHLIAMLDHSDKYVRRNAVWALGKLGPLAREAIPALCVALKDSDPRTASGAAQSLGSMGMDAATAVPALTEAMRGTNIVLCRLASKALSQIGRPALSALITHLQHRDPFVRGEAALAIGWMGPAAAAAVPELIDILREGASRLDAPSATVGSKTPVTAIIPAKPPASGDDASRAHAAQALGRIGPAAGAAVPYLEAATHDGNEQVRQCATQALRQIRGA